MKKNTLSRVQVDFYFVRDQLYNYVGREHRSLPAAHIGPMSQEAESFLTGVL